MRTRPRLSWLLGALAVLSLVAVPALAEEDSASRDEAQRSLEVFPADYERLREESNLRRAEIEARRESAEGRAERRRSRRAHSGLGRQDSIRLLHREFPALRGLRGRPLDLPPGGRVEEYLSDTVARIDPGGGQEKLLALSQVPLRVPGGEGGRKPLDLTLQNTGGSLVPESPMVPLEFEQRLSDGIAFGRGWIRIHFESGAEPAASPEASLVDQKAYYHDAARDTDFMATPVPHGLETFAQIRSFDAPQTHTLRFDLPDGLRLRPMDNGGAEIVEGDQQLVRIEPPSALDAQEQHVPVSYRVDGSRLEVVVRHHDLDAAYPILVDPVVVLGDKYAVAENWITAPGGAWMHNPSLDRMGWQPQSYKPGSGYFYGWSGAPMWFCTPSIPGCASRTNGLWMAFYTNKCCLYPAGSFGQWIWPTWGDVYVPRAEWAYFNKYSVHDPYDQTYLQLGVYSHSLKRMVSYKTWYQVPSENYYTGISNSNDWGHGTLPVMTLGNLVDRTNGYWQNTYAYLGGSILYLQDHSAPVMRGVWTDASDNVVGPGGHVHARATDAGLGVASFGMSVDGGSPQWRHHGCSGVGDRSNRCPLDAYSDQFGSTGFALDTSDWIPGSQHTVRVSAIDVLGKWSGEWSITVTYAPNATSLAYGGTNGAVDNDAEAAALGADLATRSDYQRLWSGLTLADKDFMLEQEDPSFGTWAPRIDTAPPATVTTLQVTTADSTARTAEVAWTSGSDPDIEANVAGTSVDPFTAEYRYRRVSSGEAFTWSPWTVTDEEGFTLTSVDPGDTYEVSVRTFDRAGNGDGVETTTLSVPGPEAEESAAPVVACAAFCPSGLSAAGTGAVLAGAFVVATFGFDAKKAERDSSIRVNWAVARQQSFDDWQREKKSQRRRLRRDGLAKGMDRDNEAHHIVAVGSKLAERTRLILYRCGLDPNDFLTNGVGVPRRYHRRMHTRGYYAAVYKMLAKYDPFTGAPGYGCSEDFQKGIRKALRDIAARIKNGTFNG